MRNFKMTLLALAAPVGACVTRGGEEPAPTPPRGYNFAYLAPQREAVGLIQAFDDGVHTYLEFRDPVSHRFAQVPRVRRCPLKPASAM